SQGENDSSPGRSGGCDRVRRKRSRHPFQGNNVFSDVSISSGIQDNRYIESIYDGSPGISWAIAIVDYDSDGDVDIVSADDQAAYPHALLGGIDRGTLHFFKNDGTGHFTDRVLDSGIRKYGAWMGYSFADYNADGHMDFFSTNVGDYALDPLGLAFPDDQPSLWYLGNGDGTFTKPGLGAIVEIPFGWGTSSFDYDNDGDTDILFHGNEVLTPVIALDNAGALLENDGQANFTYNANAFANANHLYRFVHDMAGGGFE
uniref:FG-GAP repeat domain-containing protein n=1 Tax=Candidatus Entotheonella palauensis TaxID=93172 RepID=UPI001177EF1C